MLPFDNNMIKLINILNDGLPHNDTTLSENLQLSQHAIQQIIDRLRSHHVPIQWLPGSGYLLTSSLTLLDPAKIIPNTQTKPMQLIIFEEIDSTNQYVINHSFNSKLSVCLAEKQTLGQGQLGNSWHSPFGQNIYLSLSYPTPKHWSELSGLSLIMGLAVCKTIESCTQLTEPAYVKWPNDVIVNKKKIAGILIETQTVPTGDKNLIIGIGLNVNMTHANQQQIPQPWTSLQLMSGHYQDRNYLCALLINNMLSYLDRFMQKGLPDFKTEWQQRDGLANQPICLISNKQEIIGQGSGINQQGHLIVTLPDNTQQSFASGNVSLINK